MEPFSWFQSCLLVNICSTTVTLYIKAGPRLASVEGFVATVAWLVVIKRRYIGIASDALREVPIGF